jgi:two-component system, OmpR family, sensor histidine kinase KdpD
LGKGDGPPTGRENPTRLPDSYDNGSVRRTLTTDRGPEDTPAPRMGPTTKARGKLRLYLGAAPGVGKTYAMLNEGWRRKERGTDVVVGWVEEHGRPQTDAQIRDLEIFPRRTYEYRGQSFEEMDLEGLLVRHPQLVLVDELAHSNVPGATHPKRWQDVEDLLAAGINVISTINLQHLESVNDVVERITGVVQHETVPDPVVRAADQIELVDMAPEALRRRLAHGNVYPSERIDTALSNYFRTGNLTALRELALLWVADRVDEELNDYRERHDIAGAWETKERVVVSLTGSPGSAVLIRRAARMAMRTKAELVGVHVRTDDSLTTSGSQGLVHNRALLDDLGGRFVEVVGTDVAPALVQVARAENATQLVIGATHRSRINEFLRGSVINAVIRAAGGALDVHVIATESALSPDADDDAETGSESDEGTRRPAGRRSQPEVRRYRGNLLSPLPLRRQLAALILGIIGFPLLTVVLTADRSSDGLATALSSYLVLVVVVAGIGGVWPAVLAAIAGFLLSNYYFAPPIHTFTIADTRDILALVMFLVTAGVVSALVDLAARRTATANQARTDARTLARIAGRMVAPEGDPLPALLEELGFAFRLEAVAVLHTDSDLQAPRSPGSAQFSSGGWSTVAAVGQSAPLDPDQATLALPLTDHEILALRGPGLSAEDREILAAFAAQLATVLEHDRLAAEASEAGSSARVSELRSALLATVGRELRSPLSSIQAASTRLLSDRPDVDPAEIRSLLETIDDQSQRLVILDRNLQDMNRLQTGPTETLTEPTDIGALLARVVNGLGPRGDEVIVDGTEGIPPVTTDPVLLERSVADLVDNALLRSGGEAVRIEAGPVAGRLDIRVIDRGPAIPRHDYGQMFNPFEQIDITAPGDTTQAESPDAAFAAGTGLGLAVARGFVEALGGDLDVEDTPGGGCTMVIRLPMMAVGPVPSDGPAHLAGADVGGPVHPDS